MEWILQLIGLVKSWGVPKKLDKPADVCDVHEHIREYIGLHHSVYYRRYKKGKDRCEKCGCYNTVLPTVVKRRIGLEG